MKKLTTVILLGVFSLLGWAPLKAQWIQKANFGGTARSGSTGFSIGDKVYLVGGTDNFPTQDVWEYNVITDAWTQKANFPGSFRTSATAFTIGNKAYVGTGGNSGFYYNDLWEYDPATDTWIQKANFPGEAREDAVSFSIAGKGYLGTGQRFFVGPNSSFTIVYNDFYEYNPLTDTWTQKANFLGGARTYASGCSVGNKGYMGFGSDANQTVSYTDFYEYNPITDVWMAKNTGAGYPVADAGMFAIGNDCYLFGGIDFSIFSASTMCRKYNTLTDTWTNAGAFPGGIIAAQVAVTANGKGYAGTGFDSGLNPRSDWWEFTAVTQTINTGIQNTTATIAQPISIWPNPAKSDITVSINNRNQNDYFFSVTNLLGKEVFSGSLPASSLMQEKIQLPTSLANGIYFFTLMNSNKTKVASKKLIKE